MSELGEDVRIDAEGMTIQGETLRMIQALAQKLGMKPIDALRLAIDPALAYEKGRV